MKLLLIAALLLAGCAPAWIARKDPAWQCRHWVCPRAAEHEYAGCGESLYDDFDDACTCLFRDGRVYTTERR